jgi:hypothetical protein
MPPWIIWLDFRQQVSIIHLGVYVLIGILIGAVIGGVYKRKVESAKKALIDRMVTEGDTYPQLIWRALLLNGRLSEKRIYLQKKDMSSKVYGYHYASYNNGYIIFASFQLVLSRLPATLRQKVKQLAASRKSFNTDRRGIQEVLKLLKDTDGKAFCIANPVVEVAEGKLSAVNENLAYLILDPGLYRPPVEDESSGYLFDIVEDEPV